MSVNPLFKRIRYLKTANWAKKIRSQFHQKKIGCQPKNIFSTPGPDTYDDFDDAIHD